MTFCKVTQNFLKTIKHYLINNGEAPLFSSKSSYPLQGGEWIILILMSFLSECFPIKCIFSTQNYEYFQAQGFSWILTNI